MNSIELAASNSAFIRRLDVGTLAKQGKEIALPLKDVWQRTFADIISK
jgi:hypothetical protein